MPGLRQNKSRFMQGRGGGYFIPSRAGREAAFERQALVGAGLCCQSGLEQESGSRSRST